MKLGPRSSLGVQVLVFVLVLGIILAIPGIMGKKSYDGNKHESPGHAAIKNSINDLTSSIALYTGLLEDRDNNHKRTGTHTPTPTPTPTPTHKPDVSPIPTPTASAGPRPSSPAKYIATNKFPVIGMSLEPKQAYRSEPIKFDSGNNTHDPDGFITAYEWDFGDGSTGLGKSVEHAYANEGNYTVRLRVVDNGGADCSATLTAIIRDKPPVALPGNDTNATVGEPIWFNGASSYDPDGRIVRYEWSFGDGTAEPGEAMMHAYQQPGTYEVTLTVTDDSGSNSTASMTVNVVDVKGTPMANLEGVQGIILQVSAGITGLALIMMLRKRLK